MKNYLNLITVMTLIVFLSSCAKDEANVNESVQVENRQRTFDPGANGFQFITPCEASGLTYYVESNCTGTEYENAIEEGIQAWNDIPSALYFTKAPNAQDADLVFNCVDGDQCGTAGTSLPFYLASIGNINPNVQTYFPSGGSIGGQIDLFVDTEDCVCTDDENDCNYTGDLDECFFKGTVMISIGSALGFSSNKEYSTTASVHIPGTSTQEYIPGSIFNWKEMMEENCVWCKRPCSIGASDIEAIQCVYPDIKILGEEHICVEELDFYCVGFDTPCIDNNESYDITWNIPGPPGENDCIGVSSSYPIVYQLEATVSGPECSFTVQKDVYVHDGTPCDISDPMPNEFNRLCQGSGGHCYTFSDSYCISELDVTSSSPNVAIYAGDGEICVYAIGLAQEVVDITIVPINYCGTPGEAITWTIMINDPFTCGGLID